MALSLGTSSAAVRNPVGTVESICSITSFGAKWRSKSLVPLSSVLSGWSSGTSVDRGCFEFCYNLHSLDFRSVNGRRSGLKPESRRGSTRHVFTGGVKGSVAVEEMSEGLVIRQDSTGGSPESSPVVTQGTPPADSPQLSTEAAKLRVGRQKTRRRDPTVPSEALIPGAVFTGTVISIQPYGAFVDFGAFTNGLVHISKLGSGFVKNVSDVVTLGQDVTVTILNVEIMNGRISLSMAGNTERAPRGSLESNRTRFLAGAEREDRAFSHSAEGNKVRFPSREEDIRRDFRDPSGAVSRRLSSVRENEETTSRGLLGGNGPHSLSMAQDLDDETRNPSVGNERRSLSMPGNMDGKTMDAPGGDGYRSLPMMGNVDGRTRDPSGGDGRNFPSMGRNMGSETGYPSGVTSPVLSRAENGVRDPGNPPGGNNSLFSSKSESEGRARRGQLGGLSLPVGNEPKWPRHPTGRFLTLAEIAVMDLNDLGGFGVIPDQEENYNGALSTGSVIAGDGLEVLQEEPQKKPSKRFVQRPGMEGTTNKPRPGMRWFEADCDCCY